MKFCGKVGYAITEETAPGVWEATIVEKTYRGDVIKNRSSWQAGESINDDINVSSDISIMLMHSLISISPILDTLNSWALNGR